ncbi:protein of unknown function (plasmid) [Shinella sp. WSC3-e]|nr:protein of unknown function [Shinella sp. WSC3-e]
MTAFHMRLPSRSAGRAIFLAAPAAGQEMRIDSAAAPFLIPEYLIHMRMHLSCRNRQEAVAGLCAPS